ncbi:MAG: thioredoxin family protein [Mariniphaga sp.]|jgi:small redox-active disulfide protein 2|nr:thioredoxin family protein [Mariniphaga sp.]
MEIKVLGTGCPKCKALEKATKNAVTELGINADIGKEEDIMKIMQYGVMHTPALVIDGKVVISGRVPNEKELKNFLTSN